MLRIREEALTFDDVLLLPAYSEVTARDVNLTTRLTKNIKLNIPLVSAAMDTVTEARLAVAMAQEGGIGIIHKSMTIAQQAGQVLAVKRHESGIVKDPITIQSNASIRDLLEIKEKYNISGVPVLDGSDLVGIVTNRDVRYQADLDAEVSTIMTAKDRLVTVGESPDAEHVKQLLHDHRIEKVLVVDDNFNLKGMITVKDIHKAHTYPMASKDNQGRLRVGASVGTSSDTDDRVAALVEAGVDVIVVDTAHGHSRNVLDRVTLIKKNFPNIDVIGGNVATPEGAIALVEAGADGVKSRYWPRLNLYYAHCYGYRCSSDFGYC